MKDLMTCTHDMQCFAFGIDNENFLMMSSTASNIQLWNQIIAVYLENRATTGCCWEHLFYLLQMTSLRMGSDSMREGKKKNLVHACNLPDILGNCESSCCINLQSYDTVLYYCYSMQGWYSFSDQHWSLTLNGSCQSDIKLKHTRMIIQ